MKNGNTFDTLKNWYFDKNTSAKDLTDEQFHYLLDCLDFELKLEKLKNGIKIYYLNDLQGANLGDIEQDMFYCEYKRVYGLENIDNQEQNNWIYIKNYAIDRLEIYLYDYYERG